MVLAAGLLLVLNAGFASAQKDPFQPLVRTETTTTTTTTTTPTTTTPAAPTTGSALPKTGFDFDIWSGVAAQMLLVGAVILLFERRLRTA